MNPFLPRHGATVNIGVSSSTQRVAIPGPVPTSVRVMNNGSATVWIEFGDVNVTTTTSVGLPIGPGGTEVLTGAQIGSGDGSLYAAAIAAGATGNVYFTAGDGE